MTWASLVASTVYTPSNILHKTGSNSAWDAGAISTRSIASSGGTGTGYVSVVADATDKERMFGLGNSNVNASDSDVEYGLRLKSNGTLEVVEGGSSKTRFFALLRMTRAGWHSDLKQSGMG